MSIAANVSWYWKGEILHADWMNFLNKNQISLILFSEMYIWKSFWYTIYPIYKPIRMQALGFWILGTAKCTKGIRHSASEAKTIQNSKWSYALLANVMCNFPCTNHSYSPINTAYVKTKYASSTKMPIINNNSKGEFHPVLLHLCKSRRELGVPI